MADIPPVVARTTWTEADYESMNWHDSALHAIAWQPLPEEPGRFLLDLDYISQWVAPKPPSRLLSSWISPATLVFEPAWDLVTEMDRNGWSFQLFLNAIRRSEPDERGNYDWTLAGDGVTITFGAPGFTQYLRRPPILCAGPILPVEERGGFGFDRRAYGR